MLLTTDAGFKPCRRFRFENVWVHREDFAVTVPGAWESCAQVAYPFINLHTKLAATARALKRWSSQFTSDLALWAAISSELIFRLDQAMDNRQLTAEEAQFRSMLKVICLGIAAIQRTMWRQRSRVQWLREGDASTRFFHSKAFTRRRKSYIHRIITDNGVFTEQADKEEAIWKYFHGLLGKKGQTTHLELAGLGDHTG